jgi:tetratricopeptide (TPR) repeat protein
MPLADRSRRTGVARLAPLGRAVLIAALCVVAYRPSLSGGFLIDDDILLTRNALVHADDGLWRFWFTNEAIDYWPVSNSSFWLEWRLWKLNSEGYRATNLILHGAISLLLWRILSLLGIPGAFLGALLFAVHPVNAESVAWISQRKTLLAMLFAQLATLAYLKSERLDSSAADARPGWISPWYGLSLLAFALALLSKISMAVLPVLLALCLAWVRPLRRRDVVRLIPFGLLAAGLGVLNVWVRAGDPYIPGRQGGVVDAALRATATGWFYLGKALFPIHLAFMYPHPSIDPQHWHSWLPLLAAVAVTVVLVRYRRAGTRPLLFAWAYYWVALLPALGFTETPYVEDHYQHLALCGVTAIAAAGWSALRAHATRTRWIVDAVAVATVAALVLFTERHATQFRDNVVLMRAAVDAYPQSPIAQRNLAFVLLEAGQPEAGIPHLEEALRLDPDSVEARKTLAVSLARIGELGRAIELLEAAVRLRPDDAEALGNLGAFLRGAGRPAESIPYFERSLRLDPRSARTHCNFGKALFETGQVTRAIAQFQEATRLDPASAEAKRLLALAIQADRGSLRFEGRTRLVRVAVIPAPRSAAA